MNYLDMIDPTDPMSVLVAADWLEESGRTTEAEALRTLDLPQEICDYVYGYGFGDGYGYGFGHSYGYGYGYGFGYEDGYGDGYGYGYGFGHGELYGDGYSYSKSSVSIKINNYLSHMRIFLEQVPSV